MPKPWHATIDSRRREVRTAILDAATALAAEHGPRSVTMSQIAERSGIGRATIAKHFPDVETILHAWHERQLAAHLELLTQVRDHAGSAGERLETVLTAYAHIQQQRVRHHRYHDHGAELGAVLHRDEHVAEARHEVQKLIRELLDEVAESGELRDDARPDELAGYCVHALGAASDLPSKAAVHRLVTVILNGLRRP
jgi:AcrR family transcriptional regulator